MGAVETRQAVHAKTDTMRGIEPSLVLGHLGDGESIVKPTDNGRFLSLKEVMLMPNRQRLVNLWPQGKSLFISHVARQNQKTGG